ncbi:MAG: hypothetical protein KDB51_12080 [Propionibacteriaceae bacterium]|nr:hypothetical protein [Propionibacteriaceae bacterium]
MIAVVGLGDGLGGALGEQPASSTSASTRAEQGVRMRFLFVGRAASLGGSTTGSSIAAPAVEVVETPCGCGLDRLDQRVWVSTNSTMDRLDQWVSGLDKLDHRRL